jgi:hypothetical protein
VLVCGHCPEFDSYNLGNKRPNVGKAKVLMFEILVVSFAIAASCGACFYYGHQHGQKHAKMFEREKKFHL